MRLDVDGTAMKSEERHQLAQNDLQVGINRWLDRIEPYTNHLLGGIVIATIVAVGVIFWVRSSSATSEAGWSQIASARSADELLQIAQDQSGTAAGNWAKLQAARLSYTNGIETALTDRKSSDESLRQAKDLYNELLKARTTPELREEALKGLSFTLEATSAGDVGEAIKAYEQFVKEFPESPFRGYAEHRIAELKDPAAAEFYAWFSKQNPKPAERPLPNDGKPAAGDALKTPDLPELDLNSDADDNKSKAGSGAPALPAVPATEGKAPPMSPPASSSPAAAPDASPPAEAPVQTTPMPMPEAPKPVAPMPMPEAPEKTAPMPTPEPPANPSPTPEPATPSDTPDLPSLPMPPVDPPK